MGSFPAPGGAHKDMEQMSQEIKHHITTGLKELKIKPVEELIQERYDKFRQMGEYK